MPNELNPETGFALVADFREGEAMARMDRRRGDLPDLLGIVHDMRRHCYGEPR